MLNYTVYTDGAYKSSIKAGGVGIVFLCNGEKVWEYSKKYGESTNQRMEVLASIIALKSIKASIDSLTIVTDSMYVIGTASKGWKRKANLDLWKRFDKALEEAQSFTKEPIIFKHVKGHDGNKYNEQCDRLASTVCYD